MRPEAELLLCCARARLEPEQADRIRRLAGDGIDWNALVEMGKVHAVAQMLYVHLRDACPDAVPGPVMDDLRAYFQGNAHQSLLLTGELLAILDLLDEHGIPAIPYKGPVLAASAYGNLALRQFGDLDLLVHPEDIPRAREVLLGSGYEAQVQMTASQERAYLRRQGDVGLVRADGRVTVEIHSRMSPPYWSFPGDPAYWWCHLTTVSLGHRQVPSLAPEALLLFLCIHNAKHSGERLIWTCDVAELIRSHQNLDWEQVLRDAAELRCKRILSLGLLLAADLLDAPLPPEVYRHASSDVVARQLAGQVHGVLFPEENDRRVILQRALFRLRTRERLADRVQYGVRLATTLTPDDWASISLPSALFPLYYVIRAGRLARNYGLSGLRWLRARS